MQRADDLRLLAAHHVRQLAALDQPRHDVHGRATPHAHRLQRCAEPVGIDRHVRIRRFAPALRAADHAGRDDRQRGPRIEPRAAHVLEGRIAGIRDRDARAAELHHALRRGALVEHGFRVSHQVRAQRSGAPVERDQARRRRSSAVP
ncbi:hypothetical protein BBJ41_35890 [Burkholderia stabilis]|nr:hypothetical protein BBJ41_35890 [Burkholderia stabilis]